MTLDISVVKRIAVQCGLAKLDLDGYISTDVNLHKFFQAAYAMGAAEQKAKDAKICEELREQETMSKHVNQIECAMSRSGMKLCAEAIRSQE